MKKKVIYLFGAGATQAVLKAISPTLSLLTTDIQEKIQKTRSSKYLGKNIWSELITVSDIEHLISVLDTQHQYHSAELIRKYYQEALVNIARPIAQSPGNNLYAALIDLHKNVSYLDEDLLCLITLNYENILEETISKILHSEIDYLIYGNENQENDSITLLKLHGSFNWYNSRPIKIRNEAISSSKSLWIPPGVEKRKENYPFNLMWGKTIEYLMDCDVLRIIGCSMSRNDWGLIPIIYTVQKFNKHRNNLTIEIIDYPDVAKRIIDNYKYLKFISITDILEFNNYYKKRFASASDEEIKKEIEAKFTDKDKTNPFYEWLDAKIDYIYNDLNIDIRTPSNILYNFYNKL